jgi:hypothetical protein
MSSNSDSACDYHPTDESDGGGGRDGEFQCNSQWHAAVELPVEL